MGTEQRDPGDAEWRAAAASGVLPDAELCAGLLSSIVEAALSAFDAAACSITVLDEEADELVFTAVAGEGSGTIEGTRFPSGAGIAGWALAAQQAIEVDEVARDPRFAADVAEETGYVPKAIMASPLVTGERALGVLSVLDRSAAAPSGLDAMELLALFARQATAALEVVQRVERARGVAAGDDNFAAVARLGAALARESDRHGDAGHQLLLALERVLSRR